jgi:hypothetical protein
VPDIHSQRPKLISKFLRDAGRAGAGCSGSPPHDGERAWKHNVLEFFGELQIMFLEGSGVFSIFEGRRTLAHT